MESTEVDRWASPPIPRQVGRLAVITGGADGLGYETALALAQAGADVIVAAENEIEGRYAIGRIRPASPSALVRFEKLDTGNLKSVGEFAGRLARSGHAIDLLINGAGVTPSARRLTTSDGFERNLGANYLGHFALTALLLPLLRRSRQPRVVQISSLGHRRGAIHFDDLQLERGYFPWKAFCQSKLATLIFALELQRRSNLHGWGLISTAAHPGYTQGEPLGNGFGPRSLFRKLRGSLGVLASHSAPEAAQPALFAATAFDVKRGGFYGPSGPFELVGSPAEATIARNAKDLAVACRLWEVSEQLTGVQWPEE
ncbi:MAG TPA: SDR family oxidoreductase [Terracidiphilus sp.]|nr:SDR family oxidoreductase [Terracidiphilus sp.]